jgi:GntR family transcriptional regulator
VTEDPPDYSPTEYVYVQVADRIAAEIADWPAGRRLPSEDELAETYGVARMTVRRAKEVLTERGLVRTLHGRGTFVVTPPEDA